MTKIIAAQKIEDVKLPAWVDRAKDVKTLRVENAEGVEENMLAVTAKLPARLRRNAKRFHPTRSAAPPIRMAIGQSVELGGIYSRVVKPGSFSCRIVKCRRTGRDIIATRGTAEFGYDREATEAHNVRYWKDAREATARS